MTATYTVGSETDRDALRLLIRDTDIPDNALFQDEELDVFLATEANVYYAAARALSTLLSHWAGKGEGVMEKTVDDFRLRWGMETSVAEALREQINEFKQRGTQAANDNRHFRVV